MRKSYARVFSMLTIFVVSCMSPYAPEVTLEDKKYLVVDGFLNSSLGVATVKISRTLPLYSEAITPMESHAQVAVQPEEGPEVLLAEKTAGVYEASNLSVNQNSKYRLRIRTSDGQEFLSAYVKLKKTPPIDSIFWKPSSDGLNIYLNTHDDTGDTRFYKWTYVQTWEYSSVYTSGIKNENGRVVPRKESEYIHRCWSEDNSYNIMVGSTKDLESDIISHFPLVFLRRGTQQLSRKYSLFVTQEAVTQEAYEYWVQLQQTTESLGGLFDSMPYELRGNIVNASNSAQPVFGYFSGGSTEVKRIFIDVFDLPAHLLYRPSVSGCEYDTIPYSQANQHGFSQLLIQPLYPETSGYLTAESRCIDCRLAGGTTTKPTYWE